jgi:hypothetical protein
VAYAPCCPGALGLEQEEKAAYAPCCPGALGLETLSLEKVAFSLLEVWVLKVLSGWRSR